MPNYRTHDAIGLAGSCIAGTYAAMQCDVQTGLLVYSFTLIQCYYFSPDLDCNSKIYNRWSIFKFVWYPYQKLVKHRSLISHSGISGLFRLLYFLFLLYIIFPYIRKFFWYIIAGDDTSIYFFIIMVICSIYADILHTFTDIIISFVSKYFKTFN